MNFLKSLDAGFVSRRDGVDFERIKLLYQVGQHGLMAGFLIIAWGSSVFLPCYSDIVVCLLFVAIVLVGINAVVVPMYSSSLRRRQAQAWGAYDRGAA